MDFEHDKQADAFREETRQFLRQHLTEEMVTKAKTTGTMHDWDLHREIAKTGVIADGLASATRSGRDPLELFVYFDELGLADAPFYGLANTMLVAGILEEVGNDFHRSQIIPRLHAGEAI